MKRRRNPTAQEHAYKLRRKVFSDIEEGMGPWMEFREIYSYGLASELFVRKIAAFSPLIEIGAGNGYWAAEIRRYGGDIVAFDDYSWAREGSVDVERLYFPVLRGSYEVLRHPVARGRTLLLVWPPPGRQSERQAFDAQALLAYRGDVFLLVGESGNSVFGSATGTTALWRLLEEQWTLVEQIESPYDRPDTVHESLMIFRRGAE